MKIIWQISKQDTKLIKDFYAKQKTDPFVAARYNRNILRKNVNYSKEQFWKCITLCLLMTFPLNSGPQQMRVSGLFYHLCFPVHTSF